MKLEDAMIWWGDKDPEFPFASVELKILDKRGNNEKFMHLSNSNGACFAGWEAMGPRKQAASILAIAFEAMVMQGILPAEAHKELMQIDEYRDWHRNFEGPFAENYRGDE